ncbi:hypothetical protein [Acidimangrovimonas pyrenivorans]|uniref:Uncharacterized protein n=1 Tax=Acidimangrovimonas pyrenivorans TaxID=2030798 RepID=A0ABV7AFX0_9RHOB
MQKSMNLIAALALAAAAAAVPVAGQAAGRTVVYKCSYHNPPPGGGLNSPIFFKVDTAMRTGVVYDGLIKHVFGKPIPVSVTVDNDKRMSFRWVVHGIHGTENGRATTKMVLRYAATIVKASHSFQAFSSFDGADNSFSGHGSCAIQ